MNSLLDASVAPKKKTHNHLMKIRADYIEVVPEVSVNFDLISRFPRNFNDYVSDKFSNTSKDFRRFSLVAEYFPKENPKTFAKYTNRIIIKRNSNGQLC